MDKYITVMFPYPSGYGLHIGHWYNYAIVDSYCKIQKYLGHTVFQPFGYDSFGLPAENYAKLVGGNPKEITEANILNFENEMLRMSTGFQTKLSTHSEAYQQRTQWLFNELLSHGLAYKAIRKENYCPSCQTVLAREQVKNETCDRCGTAVLKKELNQWFFKITDYAERLLSDLDKVDYPISTKKQQINWIGKSEGYNIDFGSGITCFTTKPETLLDVAFIVTALEEDGIEKFIGYCEHPLIKGNQIPVYTAEYVIEGYGTQYVMGVPNDDSRDASFANRHGIGFSNDKRILTDYQQYSFIKKATNYKLTDWCVSRQRTWGCSIPIEGELDTLDTFVDSSFYTIEYDKSRPVDVYVGGPEHACMHLIYSRFICKFLYDIGYIDFDEPFKKVIHQGMILGPDGEKMSKSKGNVISPLGYDPQLLRMYLMFINHYFEGGKWQDGGYKGCERFRNKLFNWLNTSEEKTDTLNFKLFENTIVSYFEAWKTNKVVSEWMSFYNKHSKVMLSKNEATKLLKLFNACF